MRETRNIKFKELRKGICEYLFLKGIAITAKYLPSVMNIEADGASRQEKNSLGWKLKLQIFQNICKIQKTSELDLLSFHLINQFQIYKQQNILGFFRQKAFINTRQLNEAWSVENFHKILSLSRI